MSVASSDIRIVNLALAHLAIAKTIETFSEKVPEARQASIWYPVAREQTLAATDWSFARKRQTLSLHGDDPPEEWTYRYQYPSDCIKFRRIWNPLGAQAPRVPYDVESSSGTKSILTNMGEAVGIYTFDLTDTTQFSPEFVLLTSHLLAHYMAMPLTADVSIQRKEAQIYRQLLLTAPANDANEQAEGPAADAPWISGSGR